MRGWFKCVATTALFDHSLNVFGNVIVLSWICIHKDKFQNRVLGYGIYQWQVLGKFYVGIVHNNTNPMRAAPNSECSNFLCGFRHLHINRI